MFILQHEIFNKLEEDDTSRGNLGAYFRKSESKGTSWQAVLDTLGNEYSSLVNDFKEKKIRNSSPESLEKVLKQDRTSLIVSMKEIIELHVKISLIDDLIKRSDGERSIKIREDIVSIQLNFIEILINEYCNIPSLKSALHVLGHRAQTNLFEAKFFPIDKVEVVQLYKPHKLIANGHPSQCLDIMLTKLVRATYSQSSDVDIPEVYPIDFLKEPISDSSFLWLALARFVLPRGEHILPKQKISKVVHALAEILKNKSIFINLIIGKESFNNYPMNTMYPFLQSFWLELNQALSKFPIYPIDATKRLFIILTNTNSQQAISLDDLCNEKLKKSDCISLGKIERILADRFASWADDSRYRAKKNIFNELKKTIIINDDGLEINDLIIGISKYLKHDYYDFYGKINQI